MSEMVPTGSKYTDDQRLSAATHYAITGNLKKVAEQEGIPRTTLVDWNTKDWWEEIVVRVRQEKSEEHIANYHKLVEEGQRVALEKLPEASARDAMIIAATATDKSRLLLNQPTSIKGDSKDLQALAEAFAKLSEDHTNIKNSVVSTQSQVSD